MERGLFYTFIDFVGHRQVQAAYPEVLSLDQKCWHVNDL